MKVLLYLLPVTAAVLVFVLLRYQLVIGKPIKGISVIRYRLIDLGQHDSVRNFFESMFFGRRRIFLNQKVSGVEWLYIDKATFRKFHPESPLKMKEKKYSFKFEFEMKRLLFGGHRCTKILSIEKTKQDPQVSKS